MELNHRVEARGASFTLQGHYQPEYRRVVDAFIENFREEDELGAGCSIMLKGKTIVDIYGGWRDGAAGFVIAVARVIDSTLPRALLLCEKEADDGPPSA